MPRWPLIVAALALGLGLQGQLAPPPAAPAPEPAGFALLAERPLVPEGRLTLRLLRDAAGCTLLLAALDQPEEMLPLLRHALTAETFVTGQLLLDGQARPLGSATMLNLRRLAVRLATGRQPSAQFLADPAHCISPGTRLAGHATEGALP